MATEEVSKVPTWLDQALFEPILQDIVRDYKRIIDFKATPALAPGENYTTLILRIEIEAESKDGANKCVHFISKIPVEAEIFRNFTEKHNIFKIESLVYNKLIPEFEQMYRNVGLEVHFAARCYELQTDHTNLLLEDLGSRGFKNTNRLEGLDMQHTESVLKKLAQWHAVSATRAETQGPYPKELVNSYYTEDFREMMDQINDNMSKQFRQCMKLYEGHEVYIESMEKFLLNYTNELIRVGKVDPTEFNVLNHGDCWSNNIMFQYNEVGKIKETYFVDFQIPKYGSPAQDLMYFLLSSTKLELKIKQFGYFIKFYHKQLVEHLQLLKYPKKLPLLREIHAMLYKYGAWGCITCLGVMPAVLLEPSDNANMENFLSDTADGSDFRMSLYSSKRYRKHVETVLPWLYDRGAIEC